jgi:hypothetical protein
MLRAARDHLARIHDSNRIQTLLEAMHELQFERVLVVGKGPSVLFDRKGGRSKTTGPRGKRAKVDRLRGFVDEDYQADPDLPWTWRAKLAEAGLGTLGDLGCHLISMAVGLMGPIESLVADTETVHPTRLDPETGERAVVENEDIASALLRFSSGVTGVISSSRSAWGRKNFLAFEVHGTKGMIRFDQERMNELRLYRNEGPASEQGFKTILTGPALNHVQFGIIKYAFDGEEILFIIINQQYVNCICHCLGVILPYIA